MVRGEQLRDGAEEVPLVLYCLIDGCVQAERLRLLHSMPDVSSALPLLLQQLRRWSNIAHQPSSQRC